MESISLCLKNVYKYYVSGRNVSVGLNGVSLCFSTGEFVAVTGESGSGKSTLAHIMAGILPWESGELYVNGQPTSPYDEGQWEQYRKDKISFIAQDYGILPGNTVLENVLSALYLAGMDKKEAAREAESLLRRVELWKLKERRAARLSSGQKQRLSIARALAKPAPVLIADEPTGNLDRENSRKIIELLAAVAGERLVIMVTHDFEAVCEQVTRQITIHDGEVEQDLCLRESARKKEKLSQDKVSEETVSKEMVSEEGTASDSGTFALSRYISGLLFRARPVWTAFMTAFFALSAFAVFAFLGTFIVALDDTFTRIYDDEAFQNGDDRRIVVARPDGQEFTQEDYDRLLSLSWAESLERYDLVQDVNYYYREDVDYEYHFWYTQDGPSTDSLPEYHSTASFLRNNSYVRTIPLLKKEETFLKAGSLPSHMDEVVAVGDESLIGTTLRVFFRNLKTWSMDSYVQREMTVVGVTDYGTGLYFDESIGRMLSQDVVYLEVLPMVGVDRQLEEDQITFSTKLKTDMERHGWTADGGQPIRLLNTNDREQIVELWYAGENLSTYINYAEVSEACFEQIVYQNPGRQVSLFLKDYSYTDRAIRALYDMGYEAISPYRVSSVRVDPVKANARLTTLVICMLALVVVAASQVSMLAAMFGLEQKNLEQLRNLGLSCRCGQYTLIRQILILTILGQLLGFGGIRIGADLGVERLYAIVKYLTPVHGLLLSAVHTAAMALVAAVACRKLRQQVFPFVQWEEDVDLAELGEEAEA